MKLSWQGCVFLAAASLIMASARGQTAKEIYFQGDRAAQKRDWAAALVHLDQSIAMEPDWFSYTRRGDVKVCQGDFPGAIADYTKALQLHPDSADSLVRRGYAKQLQGDLDGARVDYNEAMQKDPKYGKAYCARGTWSAERKDWELALQDFDYAIQLDPRAVSYYSRGNVKAAKHDPAGALADYTKAIQLEQDYSSAYLRRGVLQMKQNYLPGALRDFDWAIAFYGRANELGAACYPRFSIAEIYECHVQRGLVWIKMGNLPQAKADFSEAIKLNPQAQKMIEAEGYTVDGTKAPGR